MITHNPDRFICLVMLISALQTEIWICGRISIALSTSFKTESIPGFNNHVQTTIITES